MVDAVQLRRQHSSGDLSFDTKKAVTKSCPPDFPSRCLLSIGIRFAITNRYQQAAAPGISEISAVDFAAASINFYLERR